MKASTDTILPLTTNIEEPKFWHFGSARKLSKIYSEPLVSSNENPGHYINSFPFIYDKNT